MQIASSTNSRLFEPGAFLDSQTTDSQFVRTLDTCVPQSRQVKKNITQSSVKLEDATTEPIVGTLDSTFDVLVSTLAVLQGRVRDLEYELSRKDARLTLQGQELLSTKEFLQSRTEELSRERDLAQQYRSDWAQLELHCQALENDIEDSGLQRPKSPFFESQFPSWKTSPVRRPRKRMTPGLECATVSRGASVEPGNAEDVMTSVHDDRRCPSHNDIRHTSYLEGKDEKDVEVASECESMRDYETQEDALWRVISAGAPTFKKRRLLYEHDFEVNGNRGCCTVCPGSKWTQMKNLRAHAKLARHIAFSKRAAVVASRTYGVSSNPPASQQGSVEEYLSDVDWEDVDEEPPILPQNRRSEFQQDAYLPDLVALFHAEALQSGVSLTGDGLASDETLRALQEALEGTTIVESALWPYDDEAPSVEAAEDADEDFDLLALADSDAAVASAQEIAENYFGAGRGEPSEDYYPYPNKAMMKTDILFSSPRLRFSRSQQQAVIAWGKELGARNVPSLYALEKFQSESKRALGDPTTKVATASGNILYINDPLKMLAKMYAHLPTRQLLHSLPELTPNQLKEVWQADKWLLEVPDDVLTPMIRQDGKDFYVNELTYCQDGQWFIPERYFEYQGNTFALGRAVMSLSTGLVVSEQRTTLACATFINNWPEVEAANPSNIRFAAQSAPYANRMPNPDRLLADGLEWECPPLIVFIDDVSEKPVKDAMTASGVKDSLAMSVIQKLIATGKTLRRSTPTRSALTPEAVNHLLTEELKKYRGKAIINPLLDMPGFDVHKDTPVEPLHTHLLGIVKYFWAQTVWILEKDKKLSIFQSRLNSLSQSGLNIPKIMADYMCRYRGGLIGKHFKMISQVMVFAICDLVSEDLRKTWLAIGRLTVLIWETEIHDRHEYLVDLLQAIQDVQDFAATLSPGILLTKIKFHVLRHLVEHVARFGPAVLLSTERYESFNRIFRLCSIHSNRQAPSRDIATTFANLDRCRHILTGGHWFDEKSGQWIQAGRHVREYLKTHELDAHLLGVPTEHHGEPGTTTLPPRATRTPGVVWAETLAAELMPNVHSHEGVWDRAKSIATRTRGDTASCGDEVLFQMEGGRYSPLVFGSVKEILTPSTLANQAVRSLVVVELSRVESDVHPELLMPMLSRTGRYQLLDVNYLVCVVNVQHDCIHSGCSIYTQPLMQERQAVTRTRQIVSHKNSGRYIVNMHALHNHRYIRRALPPSLATFPTFFGDRLSLHLAAASSLRDQRLQKKLAKEASSRKQAEDARRANTIAAAENESLGLLGDDVNELEMFGSTTELLQPGIGIDLPLRVEPRGPRGRRGSARGNRTNAGLVLDPGMPSTHGNSNGSVPPSADWMSRFLMPAPTPHPLPGPPGLQDDPFCTPNAGILPDSHGVQNTDIMSHNSNSQDSSTDSSANEGPWVFSNSPLIPPSSNMLGMRRERDYDEDTQEGPQPPPSQRRVPGQHMRQFASQQASAHGLNAEQAKAIIEFSELKLAEMIIVMHVAMLKHENMMAQRMLRLYVRHADFQLRLRNHIAAALLAVDVRAYVKGVLTQMMDHFRDNLDALGLPPITKDDPVDWQMFRTSVSDELAVQRSWMKGKINASCNAREPQDIYTLTSNLLIYGIKPRSLHFGRFAFLRWAISQFNKTKKPGQNGKHWEYVDERIAEMRAGMRQYPPAQRRMQEAAFFANMLAEDQVLYPTSSGALMRQTYDDEAGHDWQRNMEVVVSNFIVDDDDVGQPAV
ncbi:hypothetical protein EW026_g4840 [Hermanssonia centrifuga]|uniref:Uncharacterized protein n=1 Tax=Hermanssonia centrifuga TaxID=98765 RepID=A0A4S4KFY6_9APHY|nr:hypothetical protein EW026_g4840 [Hermanssonia centrifuga]